MASPRTYNTLIDEPACTCILRRPLTLSSTFSLRYHTDIAGAAALLLASDQATYNVPFGSLLVEAKLKADASANRVVNLRADTVNELLYVRDIPPSGPAPPPPPPTAAPTFSSGSILESGVTVLLSLPQHDTADFVMYMTPNAESVSCSFDGPGGDPDLYIKWDEEPRYNDNSFNTVSSSWLNQWTPSSHFPASHPPHMIPFKVLLMVRRATRILFRG